MKGLEIRKPNDSDFGFKYPFSYKGISKKFYLTYELTNDLSGQPVRNLLLTDQTCFLEDNLDKEKYNELIEQIRLHSIYKGNINTAKCIVNKIYESSIKIDNVSIAVYKYGAIPVYKVPGIQKVFFNDTEIECQICIFPQIRDISNYSEKPIGTSSQKDFLESLKIRLDLIFLTYLEDVAERFFDIENHSNLISAFRNAKKVEVVLAESVKTKIEKIQKPPKSKKGIDEIITIIDSINQQYSSLIFKIQYARIFALFFLNELYRILGLKVEEKYQKKLVGHNSLEVNEQFFSDDIELETLKDTYNNYISCKVRGECLKRIKDSVDNSSHWLNRFVSFARFISFLNMIFKKSDSSKIFLSYHHDVPISEIVKVNIKKMLKEEFDDTVELLYVAQNKANLPFKDFIKANIWLGDATYAVIPRNTQPISTPQDKDYKWVTREGCHTLLLNKEIVFLVEKHLDSSMVLADFSDTNIEYLAPEARGFKKNKELIDWYNNNINIVFEQKEFEHFDLNLKDKLLKEIKSLKMKKVINIFNAWLNQFDLKTRRFIVLANRNLTYQYNIQKVVELLFASKSPESRKKFKKMIWLPVSRRQLYINGRYFKLIETTGKSNNTKYKASFPIILKQLLPSPQFCDDERMEVLEPIYQQYII